MKIICRSDSIMNQILRGELCKLGFTASENYEWHNGEILYHGEPLASNALEQQAAIRLRDWLSDDEVSCAICGGPTRMKATKRCDRCYELERRIGADPYISRVIVERLFKAKLIPFDNSENFMELNETPAGNS